MEEVYIPFYRPYGMSEEEFEEEIRAAHNRAEEQALNEQIELDYYQRQPNEGDNTPC